MINQNVKDMTAPVSSTRSTRTSNFTTSFAPVAIASVAVKMGDVISKIGGFIGSIFKGKTTHADWDSANNAGKQYGQEIESSVRSEYGNTNADKISVLFRQYMIAYLSSIDRWGEGYPENKAAIINNLKNFNPSAPQLNSIAYTFWGWNMWAMRNTDANRPDDYAIIATADMQATLYRAIKDVTGQTVTTIVPSTGAITTAPGTSPSSAGLLSGNNALILAAVGVGAFIFFRKG